MIDICLWGGSAAPEGNTIMKNTIELAMNGDVLEINLKIKRVENEEGLYNILMNGEEACLSMLGANEVDDLTVDEILRCLYDKSYGSENPRFDSSHDGEALII